jgi:hypothetical protein
VIILPQNVANRIKIHAYLKSLDFDELGENPMWPRCERVALRDIGYTENKTGQCPACGYKGRMDTTLNEYARRKLYK